MSRFLVPQDPLYGSWQRGVDWFAAAIRMPAEKRYNSVLFGGTAPRPTLGPPGVPVPAFLLLGTVPPLHMQCPHSVGPTRRHQTYED